MKTEYTDDHIKANGGPRKFASNIGVNCLMNRKGLLCSVEHYGS